MKKNLSILILIAALTTIPVSAEFAFTEKSDYTGENFFKSAGFSETTDETEPRRQTQNSDNVTTPPIKALRLLIKDKVKTHNEQKYELAPTAADIYSGEVETSEYASKEVKEEFDENTLPDGFEADEQSVAESEKIKHKGLFKKKNKQEKKEDTEDIVLTCDNVDYDTPNYLLHATGNVVLEFVKQGTTVIADVITYDRVNNTIKAEGNVKIKKSGKVVSGDYIFVDMNEENALIENPVTHMDNISIHSQKGYIYGDKIVQENGRLTVDDDMPINFTSDSRSMQIYNMMRPQNETLSSDMEKRIITVSAKDIVISQKGDLETIAVKKFKLFKNNKTLFKMPAIKFYTNKNHEYVESNVWEIGSLRGLGMYTGPGWVFELPKGSVFKAIPMINYQSGFGIGGVGRFNSGTNQTSVAYGTAVGKFILDGYQKLDDNLRLQYGINNYQDEWFLGRRRPKYGIGLIYQKNYSSSDFLLKGKRSSFTHRAEVGYYHNLDFDNSYEKLSGADVGTSRFRYMAEISQTLYNYMNQEKLTAFRLSVNGQMSAALYGTGDTQVIGRFGPSMHTQYRRWMQDIGYYFSDYRDDSPLRVFDAYRYGKQNLYVHEHLRLCRYLTLSWFGSFSITSDSPNGKNMQENAFYLSFGPDDVKFNLGYDFIRETLYFALIMRANAKGATVDYERMEIKQDKKAENNAKNSAKEDSAYVAPKKQTVLQKAVIEDIKVTEEVL